MGRGRVRAVRGPGAPRRAPARGPASRPPAPRQQMTAPGEEGAGGSSPESGSSGASQGSGRRPARIYSIVVGLAFIALILIAGVNSLRTGENRVLGAGGEGGRALAQFAVPEARGPVEGDANVRSEEHTSELQSRQ